MEGPRVVTIVYTRSCLLLLSTMVDERPQTAKESNVIGKHLTKLFRRGTPSRSSSPQPSASTLRGDVSSSQGTINNLIETPVEQGTPKSAYLSTAKDILGVASSFTQMLLKKAPDVVDGNPVKVAFGIAKTILQIKDVCHCSSCWCPTDWISGRERQSGLSRATDFIYSSPAPCSTRSTGHLETE